MAARLAPECKAIFPARSAARRHRADDQGLIATHVSWKAIFWINIPLGIVAAALLAIALKEEAKQRRHHIDYIGALLMASATTIIMMALIHADTFSSAALAGASCASANWSPP